MIRDNRRPEEGIQFNSEEKRNASLVMIRLTCLPSLFYTHQTAIIKTVPFRIVRR